MRGTLNAFLALTFLVIFEVRFWIRAYELSHISYLSSYFDAQGRLAKLTPPNLP